MRCRGISVLAALVLLPALPTLAPAPARADEGQVAQAHGRRRAGRLDGAAPDTPKRKKKELAALEWKARVRALGEIGLVAVPTLVELTFRKPWHWYKTGDAIDKALRYGRHPNLYVGRPKQAWNEWLPKQKHIHERIAKLKADRSY